MPEPVLNCHDLCSPARIRSRGATCEHVWEGEASALANALDQAVHGVGCEGGSALGLQRRSRFRGMPTQLSQCPDFIAAKRVNAGLAILDLSDGRGPTGWPLFNLSHLQSLVRACLGADPNVRY